jgi:hypothetical protein
MITMISWALISSLRDHGDGLTDQLTAFILYLRGIYVPRRYCGFLSHNIFLTAPERYADKAV